MSPTQRSLKWLRKNGFVAEVVERWNPWSRTRKDLFGIVDIVAIKRGSNGVCGVQATSKDHISARVKKAQDSEHLGTWLAAGNSFIVHGWGKFTKRNKSGAKSKIKEWRLVERQLTKEVNDV